LITLDALSSDRPPPFVDLQLTIAPRDLPVVVCPDDEERLAFVSLLLGRTPESGGRFLHGDEPLDPEQREQRVNVLHREDALLPDHSIIENIQLQADMIDASVDAAQRSRLLSFARIANGRVRPDRVPAESRLRLTLALDCLGSWALLVAFDPPAEVARVLPELLDDRRCLLIVAPSLQEIDPSIPISGVHHLAGSRLDSEVVEPVKPQVRRFRFRTSVTSSNEKLQNLLAAHPGVNISRAANGEMVLDMESSVSGPRLIRLMVQAGVGLESIREDFNRSR
jgi:hypothetical protein